MTEQIDIQHYIPFDYSLILNDLSKSNLMDTLEKLNYNYDEWYERLYRGELGIFKKDGKLYNIFYDDKMKMWKIIKRGEWIVNTYETLDLNKYDFIVFFNDMEHKNLEPDMQQVIRDEKDRLSQIIQESERMRDEQEAERMRDEQEAERMRDEQEAERMRDEDEQLARALQDEEDEEERSLFEHFPLSSRGVTYPNRSTFGFPRRMEMATLDAPNFDIESFRRKEEKRKEEERKKKEKGGKKTRKKRKSKKGKNKRKSKKRFKRSKVKQTK